jgi:hypothetical protein
VGPFPILLPVAGGFGKATLQDRRYLGADQEIVEHEPTTTGRHDGRHKDRLPEA